MEMEKEKARSSVILVSCFYFCWLLLEVLVLLKATTKRRMDTGEGVGSCYRARRMAMLPPPEKNWSLGKIIFMHPSPFCFQLHTSKPLPFPSLSLCQQTPSPPASEDSKGEGESPQHSFLLDCSSLGESFPSSGWTSSADIQLDLLLEEDSRVLTCLHHHLQGQSFLPNVQLSVQMRL